MNLNGINFNILNLIKRLSFAYLLLNKSQIYQKNETFRLEFREALK